jgi:hypothetical protein
LNNTMFCKIIPFRLLYLQNFIENFLLQQEQDNMSHSAEYTFPLTDIHNISWIFGAIPMRSSDDGQTHK